MQYHSEVGYSPTFSIIILFIIQPGLYIIIDAYIIVAINYFLVVIRTRYIIMVKL